MRRLSGIVLCATFVAAVWSSGYGATDAPSAEGDRYPDQISTTTLTYSIEKTAQRYADVMGVNEWKVSTERGELTTWKGQVSSKQQVVFERAVGRFGGIQLELLQPPADVDVFQQFLSNRGGAGAYSFDLGESAVKSRILADLNSGKLHRSMTLRTADGEVVTWVATQELLGVPIALEEKHGQGAASHELRFDAKGIPNAGSAVITHLCIVVRDAARVTPGWEQLFGTKFTSIILPTSAQEHIVVRDLPLNTSGFGENILKGAAGQMGPMSPVGPLGHTGPVQIEILEPVWGEAADMLYLREHGEGIYHMGMDMDGTLKENEASFRKAGYIIDMTGVLWQKFKFILFYTRDLGADLELLGPAPNQASD